MLWPALLALFIESRAYWQLPDGSAWQPGYITAETPPAALDAVRRRRNPSLWFAVSVTVLLAIFAVRYGWIIAAQMKSG
jgi:hypothetical protein